MALRNYSSEGANLTVFGIPVEEFGDTDPAITIEDVEDRSTLKRGIGGTSLRMDNQTNPKRVTVNLMPGSDEARQILAAARSGVDAALTFSQTGTNEKVACFDGVLTQRGQVGRGGKTSVSDEQFIFEFADSEES
jgi:hypothetical protein